MRFKLLSSILVSASMVVAPVAAAAQAPAAKLSVVNARAGAPASGGNGLVGEGAGGIVALALLAGIAAILIVGELASDSDDDPVSA